MSCLAAVCVMLRKQLKYARHCIPPNDRVLMLKTIHLLLQLLAHICSSQAVAACVEASRLSLVCSERELGKRFTENPCVSCRRDPLLPETPGTDRVATSALKVVIWHKLQQQTAQHVLLSSVY